MTSATPLGATEVEATELGGGPGGGLRALLRRPAAERPAPGEAAERDTAERCDLCAEPLPEGHRHMLDVQRGAVLCACGPCGLLFPQSTAGGRHYKPLPERRLPLPDLRMDAMLWARLGVPVGLAFFVRDGASGEIRAGYPSPLGVTASSVEAEVWEELARGYPELAELADDVEALLVHRTDGPAPGQEGTRTGRGAEPGDGGTAADSGATGLDRPRPAGTAHAPCRQWIVPLDDCYRLAALVRTHWRGLSGGPEVREHIDAFFAGLACPSRTADEPRSEHG
ncbi:DUF5947 family protein [Streptomyces marispadix]|uniref:DUF5947 family protein n=1 Tax=Streptomyces marispadix TaxID=2922868 RepID=A0ABS9ST22_9ACTN|nr:DUF5947 family protein [Streptomyces marispadix]MCH6159397.1 DUF5947 family protein [Streptomyces marispadix]